VNGGRGAGGKPSTKISVSGAGEDTCRRDAYTDAENNTCGFAGVGVDCGMKSMSYSARILSVLNLLKRVGFVFLLLLTIDLSQAQPPALRWTHEYGNGIDSSWIYGMVVLPGNDLVAYGGVRHNGCTSYCDGLLMKINQDGAQEWRNLYSFPNGKRLECFNRGVLAPDARIVCVGRGHESSTSLSAFIAKIDDEGDTLWVSFFGYSPFDEANDVVVVDDAIYVSGRAYNEDADWQDWPIVAKFNLEGELLWQHFFGQSSTNDEVFIAYNSTAGLFALETKTVRPGVSVPIVFSVTEDGAFGTADTIHLRNDSGVIIRQFIPYSNQGFVMSGESTFQFATSPLVCRFDNNMDTVWTKSFSHDWAGLQAYDLIVRNDGTIITCLDYNIYFPDEDEARFSAQFVRTDQAGDTIWTRFIGMTPQQDYRDGPVAALSDGSYYFGSNVGIITTHFSLSRSFPDTIASDISHHDWPLISPSLFSLSTYPNPFNSTLSISLEIPLHQEVTISLYDLLGREVDVIQRGRLENTTLSYTAPPSLASGIYFVRAVTAHDAVMQKVVLLK